MLSTKSDHIINLYKDKVWNPKVINIILKTVKHVKIDKSNIKETIEINSTEKNSDKKIIEKLGTLVENPVKGYISKENYGRAYRKWKVIKPIINNMHINGLLDYGGGIGDTAFILGRKILKLEKDKTFVIDIDEFGGFKYIPRNDITFIHFNDIDKLNTPVDLITISHVLHHIDYKLYPKIIELFNRILSKNGIIMLYEHDCSNKRMESIINIEHCLYDVVNSKKITYDKFVGEFYAKYLNIKQWIQVFNKYFTPVKIIELKNSDNSFYMFLKRKK